MEPKTNKQEPQEYTLSVRVGDFYQVSRTEDRTYPVNARSKVVRVSKITSLPSGLTIVDLHEREKLAGSVPLEAFMQQKHDGPYLCKLIPTRRTSSSSEDVLIPGDKVRVKNLNESVWMIFAGDDAWPIREEFMLGKNKFAEPDPQGNYNIWNAYRPIITNNFSYSVRSERDTDKTTCQFGTPEHTRIANLAQHYPAILRVYQYGFSSLGGGPLGCDTYCSFEALAIFVPSEQLLISREGGQFGLISGPINDMYCAVQGTAATKIWDEQTKISFGSMELRKAKSRQQNTLVSKEFIDWAKALHEARNPLEDLNEKMNQIEFTQNNLDSWVPKL